MRDFKSFTTDQGVTHYTCNSPKNPERYWMKQVWENFWIWACEVLLIPFKLFAKFGMSIANASRDVIQITSENLLAKLK